MMRLRIGMSVLMVLAVSVAAWAEPEVQKVVIKAPDSLLSPAFLGTPLSLSAGGPAKLVKAAFLGVGTSPLRNETLRRQLGLPEGVGLVVLSVPKGGPAAKAGVVVHDVLHKLDDQLLVNPEQLAVLVRMHKAGDTVSLTVIRGGKPLVLSVKLVEKLLPPLAALSGFGPSRFSKVIMSGDLIKIGELEVADGSRLELSRKGGRQYLVVKKKGGEVVFSGFFDTKAGRKAVPADLKKYLEKFKMYMRATKPSKPSTPTEPDAVSSTRLLSTSGYSLTLVVTNGVENLLVKDKKGKTIFDGPVNTPELKAKLPAGVLPLLKRLRSFKKQPKMRMK